MSQPNNNPGGRPTSSPASSTSISASLQSLRQVVGTANHLSHNQALALQALDEEYAARNLARQSSLPGSATQVPSAESSSAETHEHARSTSPSQIARARRRMFRPLSRHSRARNAMERLERLARSENNETTSSTHMFHPATSSIRPRSSSEENGSQVERKRDRPTKRRKLNDGTSDDERKPAPVYGNGAGTFEPAPLTMTVLPDSDHMHRDVYDEHMKHNITKPNNTEIYRSKRSKTNFLMKHSGAWPFTLSHIDIKVPTSDVGVSPIQGMVFVSRTQDSLLARASIYDDYWPAIRHYHIRRRPIYESYRPSRDYLQSVRGPPRRPPPPPQYDSLSDGTGHWISLVQSQSHHQHVPIANIPGFDLTITPLTNSDGNLPSSPRTWHDADAEYTRRAYADRYRTRYPSYNFNSEYVHDPADSNDGSWFLRQGDAERADTSPSVSESDGDDEAVNDDLRSNELNAAYHRDRVALDAARRAWITNADSTNLSTTPDFAPAATYHDQVTHPSTYEALQAAFSDSNTDDSDVDILTFPGRHPRTQADTQERSDRTLPRPANMPPSPPSSGRPPRDSSNRGVARVVRSGKRLPGYDAEQATKQAREAAEKDIPLVPHVQFLLRREVGGIRIKFEPAV